MKITDTIDRADQEAYLEFVRTLFADSRSLIVGAVLQVLIMMIVLYDTRFMPILLFIAGVFISSSWRIYIGHRHELATANLDTQDIAERVKSAENWENQYILPSALSAANVGVFCYFGLQVSDTELALSAVLCLMFTPLPTIVGRLYGSLKLVGYMLFGLFAPVITGYFTHGDIPHFLLGMMCIPYVLLVLNMVKNVRGTVMSAVHGNAEKVALGKRFDVALSNMSHGLIMFDTSQRISVINDMALELFGLPKRLNLSGRSFDLMIRYARRFNVMPKKDAAALASALDKLIGRAADRQQILLEDGRYFECTASARDTGGLVVTIEDVTQRFLASQKIERMAKFDSLTNLPNRQHFENLIDEIVQAAPADDHCTLIVVDIDDFKYVNDAIGHAQGDALLKSVAERLNLGAGTSHIVSRLGGDEFLLFVHGLPNQDAASTVVSYLIRRLGGIHDLGAEQVYVSCSIGHCFQPTRDFVRDEVIVRADLALYAAKKSGKGVAIQFEDSMDVEYQRRQKIKKQLGKAVEAGELSIIYQPLVDAKTGRLISCEALSRWYDTEFGIVSPAEYIPLAEEMGIVPKISEQVLHEATRTCANWPGHVSVSVNLSPVDFRTGDILATIESALAQSGLEPHRLEVEITETAVISNEKEMIEKLRAINARGVNIALDDFGTGHSSLSYLHRLPLNKVKIDRSFVVGIDTGETPIALLRGVTDLCRTLELDVTVEGVETESQLKLVVNEAHVDRVQGFVFGPGLPASGIETLSRLGKLPIKSPKEAGSVS